MENYEISSKDIMETFKGESYYRTLDLLEKTRRLVPLGHDHKINYLSTLIEYVDGIINGDDITRLTTKTYMTEFAREALIKLVHDVHERTLEVFLEQRSKLQKEVSTLSTDKETLTSQVDKLEQEKAKLVSGTSSLSIELSKLQKKIDDLRLNGMAQAEAEISIKRQELKSEIDSLEDTKSGLEKYIEELKSTLDNYSKTLKSLGTDSKDVSWETIKNDNPIYSVTKENIKDYILALKKTYKKETGVSEEECNTDFNTYAPGLKTIVSTLIELGYSNYSISYLIDNKLEFMAYNRSSIDVLENALRTLKLPVYEPKLTDIDTFSLKPETVPTNINIMLRELYLQKTAAEAITKQRILEAEIRSLISVLMSVAPKDFDFTGLSSLYGNIDESFVNLLESDNPNLSLK